MAEATACWGLEVRGVAAGAREVAQLGAEANEFANKCRESFVLSFNTELAVNLRWSALQDALGL